MSIPRYASLVYATLLATIAFTLLIVLSVRAQLVIPDIPAFVGFILFSIVVAVFGFPAPQVGYVSLDRVVQFATILIFGTLPAAWIAGIASLVWPFLPWGPGRNRGMRVTLVRALSNSGMFVLILLATGGLYRYFGGRVPLTALDPRDVLLIIILALFMQLLNNVFVAVVVWLENYDWRSAFTLFSAMVDLGSVPLAVFTAVIYNRLESSVFALFLIVLALIVLVVRNFADTRSVLEARVEELLAVNRVGRAVTSLLVLDDLIELVFRECRKLLHFDTFMLALYDESGEEIDIRLHHNPQGRQPPRRRKLGEGVFSWVIANNEAVFIRNWDSDDSEFKRMMIHLGDTPQVQSFLAVPMTYRGRALGVLSVQGYTADMFDQGHLHLMMTFAGQVAVAIANARLFEELERGREDLERRVSERTRELALQKDELHALTESLRATNRENEMLLARLRRRETELERQTWEDDLTGLYNRRYLDARLENELKRAERYRRDFAVAMADIDHFKVVNDRHSHMVGDEVLRVIAGLLRGQCRSVDIIARYGGEEFLLCFPETSLQGAAAVCEKIRRQVQEYDWNRLQPGMEVTISFGVAAAPPMPHNSERLIAEADEKLYQAKHSGRNRVCT